MNGAVYDALSGVVERRVLGAIRAQLLRPLRGEIVEVGVGTGVDFEYYARDAHVLALEPDPAMARRALAKMARAEATIDVRIRDDACLDALAPASVDAVVFPLVLCSIADPLLVLTRAKRVLRPNGQLVVLEHVRGRGRVAAFQDWLHPIWSRLAGGCRLHQETRELLERTGFVTDELELRHITDYFPIQDLLIGSARMRDSSRSGAVSNGGAAR